MEVASKFLTVPEEGSSKFDFSQDRVVYLSDQSFLFQFSFSRGVWVKDTVQGVGV